jgi:hypothetical protein
MTRGSSFIRKAFKAILWIVIVFVLLFFIVSLLIQIPVIQNRMLQYATSLVSNKTHTRVEINNIRFAFPKSLSVGGLYIEDLQSDTLIYIGNVKISIALTDLLSKKISIKSIVLENSSLGVNRIATDSLFNYNYLLVAPGNENKLKNAKLQSDPKWRLSVDKVSLKNIRLRYEDKYGGTNISAFLGELELKINEIDPGKSIYTIEELFIEGLNANVWMQKQENAGNKVAQNDLPEIRVNKILIVNSAIKYQAGNKSEEKNAFDPNHFTFNHLTLEATGFYYSFDEIKVSIKRLNAIDQNNFSVTKLETDFSLDKNSVSAKNLRVRTSSSSLEADVNLHYSSLKSIKDSLSFLIIHIDVKNASILNSDIIYFNKKLTTKPFFNSKANITTLSGTLKGRINNLEGKKMVIQTGGSTILKTDFRIIGLPDIDSAIFNFPNLKVNSDKRDIEMIAFHSVPAGINLPEKIDMKIAFKGKIKSFESTIELNSSFGAAQLIVKINNDESFMGNLDIANFDLGKLLKDTVMYGPVTLSADVKGHGLDINKIKANINARIAQIHLNRYDYHNLNLDGNITGLAFEGKIDLNDENAMFNFDGLVNLNRNKEHYKFNLNIEGVDLQKLNITKDDIRIGLNVAVDLSGDDATKINGNVIISNVIIARDEKTYLLDSILVTSINEAERSEFNLTSALIGIKYTGTLSPGNLSSELLNFINNYFPFSDSIKLKRRNKPSNFDFEIQLHNHPILSQALLPQLKEFEPGNIKGSFDSKKNELKLMATVKKIVYGTIDIQDFLLEVNSNQTAVNYNLSTSSLTNTQISIDNFLIDGKISDKTIFANATSTGDKHIRKFAIHSRITKDNTNFRLSLDTADFYLKNNHWDIAADNYIKFGKEGFLIHNLVFHNAESEINIASVHEKFKDDLNIAVKNFNLSDISSVIEKDTSLVRGIVNGNILFKRVNKRYGIIADTKISSLAVRNIPIGNISLKADNQKAGRFNIDLNLSGAGNDMAMNGFFIPEAEGISININTTIQSLALKSIEAFSMGQISETSGTLSGNILFNGSLDAPEVNGELIFKNAFIKPAILNNRIELKHEAIQFNNREISFKGFTLRDIDQHTAIIDGTVEMKKFKNFVFNLNIHTEDFLLSNTTFTDNKKFYGRMIIDSRIDITGPLALPVINGKIKMKNGSNFTFAVPEDKMTTDRGENVVEFEDSLRLNPILYKDEKKVAQKSIFRGFNVSSIIEIDKKATLRLLMDPASNDSLVVKGEAALSFIMDRSGKMSLTGAYDIAEGSYLISLESVIKRKFEIIAGSTIIWNGDPLDAVISINASYSVRASPYDLVAVQMSGMSDTEKSGYKQRYPFLVLLKLRGEILHPVISFELQLPPQDKGILGGAVNLKLNMLNEDESALNKQVFALLVLGRFVQENPLQTESGGATALVRSTVGNFLSGQLNKLSSKVIPGTELNFDIQSYDDYQTGQARGRTQVGIGLKKELFRDRLSIQVGGTVDVEGEKAKQNSASDITGDVTVEYKLTEDGRYRLKAFRHNQYEGAIEGQLIESGAGLVYVRDFNIWKEFFKPPKKKRDGMKNEQYNDTINTK